MFFAADILREEVQRHGETITDCAHKDVVIRVISNRYSDVKGFGLIDDAERLPRHQAR